MATKKSKSFFMKIYDCSNSSSRSAHRGHGGPVENACITLLKKHASNFNCEFVSAEENADLIFTNDVFPKSVLKLDIPRVKRMDGIFWQLEHQDRNTAYNEAARNADHVIFTSEHCRRSYYQLCGDLLKCESVALNWVDTSIFYPDYKIKEEPKYWIAVATSWERPEKRKYNMYFFAEFLRYNGLPPLKMIGFQKFDDFYSPYIIVHEYVKDQQILAQLLRNADAFVNLSYRDASPKVVAEAISCGLPVLYANSGGVSELVPYGIGVSDKEICDVHLLKEMSQYVKNQTRSGLEQSFNQFYDIYINMRRALLQSNEPKRREAAMLNHYFEVFKNLET